MSRVLNHTESVDINHEELNMKSVLLETVLVMGALILWAFALPVAAILFVAATAWKKTSALLIGEPFGPATARMSRAGA